LTRVGGWRLNLNQTNAQRDVAGPFALPTVDLFAKFCRHLVDKSYGIGSLLHQGEITALEPLPGGAGFQLEVLQGGRDSSEPPRRMTASNVVLVRMIRTEYQIA
jgi:hypothetical protein